MSNNQSQAELFERSVDALARGLDAKTLAEDIVGQMTLTEKLSCLDGEMAFWPGLCDLISGGYHEHTWDAAQVARLGIPGLHFSDGPRGAVVGKSTTFPVTMARGASFDPALEERVGVAIGKELRAQGATYTGAVCMNLLRHPSWGRAQETYSEDPYHMGEMAVALTLGLQTHVMACAKHYALNSMENKRFEVDITADERTLHEVYLPHFKRVAQAGVASFMSSYNSVNGEWAGENKTLLIDILREDWGWDGFVITDFVFGLRDAVKSVQAGCNIEMPFRQQRSGKLPKAIKRGELSVKDVEVRVSEIIATFLRFSHVYRPVEKLVIYCQEHRDLARETAVSSIVMLQNNGLLPLNLSTLKNVAVLGELAATPNLGDEGSSNVKHTPDPVTPLKGLVEALPNVRVSHSNRDATIAKDADAVIVVVGFTKADEGEFLLPPPGEMKKLFPFVFDRKLGVKSFKQLKALRNIGRGGLEPNGAVGGDRAQLRLKPEDEALIAEARAQNDNVIVAVMAGSTVIMPWLEEVSAAMMLWYPGSEGGHALADVLFGAEPGGRLPFVMPYKESDLVEFDRDAPAFTYGLLHGQWHLDATRTKAHRPFGFGLSYANFDIVFAKLRNDSVSVKIKNKSKVDGSTVLMVFGGVVRSAYERPQKKLLGFQKVNLKAGASITLDITPDLSTLDIRENGSWLSEAKDIQLYVGFNAGDTIKV